MLCTDYSSWVNVSTFSSFTQIKRTVELGATDLKKVFTLVRKTFVDYFYEIGLQSMAISLTC